MKPTKKQLEEKREYVNMCYSCVLIMFVLGSALMLLDKNKIPLVLGVICIGILVIVNLLYTKQKEAGY